MDKSVRIISEETDLAYWYPIIYAVDGIVICIVT